MKNWILTLIILIVSSCYFACSSPSATQNKNDRIYGITLNSIEDFNESISAIEFFSKRVTTRVVFDENISAVSYYDELEALSPHTDIMGTLLDSSAMSQYTMTRYKERITEYYDTLGEYVSIWEIGNEVNGIWTGSPHEVSEKLLYTYQEARKRGYKTALTLYYNDYDKNDGCWLRAQEKMRSWVRTYLDQEIIDNVDYVLISYYEEDCADYRPEEHEWEEVFIKLGDIFPNSKVGFGEVGTNNDAIKGEYLNYYYTMDISHPRFIGGYFWWYAKQDMVPSSLPLWYELNTILQNAE